MVFFADSDAAAPFRGRLDRDTRLTDSGRIAAQGAGRQLRAQFEYFDVVIDSGFVRTRQTADLLLEAWSAGERAAIERRSNDLIREREPGDAVNMTTAEAAAAFPWLTAYWQEAGRYRARPPGGESLEDVGARVRQFIEAEWPTLAERRVLLVTHVGTAQMLRMCLDGWLPDQVESRMAESPIGNCGVVAYEFDSAGAARSIDVCGSEQP
jgi:broad specificity phosphatase PhoE